MVAAWTCRLPEPVVRRGYDGSLINWMAVIEWRFAKNWRTGVGYRYVEYKVEGMKSDFRGEIDYRFGDRRCLSRPRSSG